MSATAEHPSTVGDSFGPRLRRERERRQIALASIAENSKISVSLFQDLERDDVSHWPSGIVFRRAFIRAYAQAVGLDVDATTQEFLERFPDPSEPVFVAAPAPPPKSTLRLTLAQTGISFLPGRILPSAQSRCAAVACDAVVMLTLGLVIYAVLGTLWMPLCLALVVYYAGGILLLGNTPGVCLTAPGARTNEPTSEINVARLIRSYAAWIVSAVQPKPRQPEVRASARLSNPLQPAAGRDGLR
jgi:transcriptional regulator with XRE-family HTH domain